jgi:hypothetical protein
MVILSVVSVSERIISRLVRFGNPPVDFVGVGVLAIAATSNGDGWPAPGLLVGEHR